MSDGYTKIKKRVLITKLSNWLLDYIELAFKARGYETSQTYSHGGDESYYPLGEQTNGLDISVRSKNDTMSLQTVTIGLMSSGVAEIYDSDTRNPETTTDLSINNLVKMVEEIVNPPA